MSEEKVKLTVRLPKHVHQALKERAVEYGVSLNQALVDALETELAPAAPVEETEADKARRVLHETGLLVEMDHKWDHLIGDEADIPSVEEVRKMLGDIPLSDWIIEDRGPR
jgi:hypothetical protein